MKMKNDMTDLSPSAQAVMTAGTMGNPNVINDPVYRQCIAAALRAAACQLGYELLGVRTIDCSQLLLIAEELEGA